MSRRRTNGPQDGRQGGPKLPFAMQQRLGLSQTKKRQSTQIADRKQKRRDARRPPIKQRQRHAQQARDEEEGDASDVSLDVASDDDDIFGGGASENALDGKLQPSPVTIKRRSRSPATSSETEHEEEQDEEGAESESQEEDRDVTYDRDGDSSDELSRGSREYSPEIILDAGSRTFQDKQAEEDAEILALEKKLCMKGQKRKAGDDGLDGLVEGLQDGNDAKRRKKEEKAWLERKRHKAQEGEQPLVSTNDESSTDEFDGSEIKEDDFEGFEDNEHTQDEDNHQVKAKLPKHKAVSMRENPYVAPVPVTEASTSKYVPPSRRKIPETDTEKLGKLRRQAQGSLNKLSEANIISIVDEFDKFYQSNPRQDVNTVLIDLLLAAFTNQASLQNTYIILHAAFVAALYKILGADFGAEMISKLIETLDTYQSDPRATGKEALNLISLLANLFTFNVINSTLVYDHIRLLLSAFSENSAELLLRIMRDCGPQLRSDDPAALKGIVQMMNDVSATMTSNGQTINIRTRVMMDTITDLKNNKIRQATNAAGATGEHLTRMRKALGSLNSRQLRATEPLGITRGDILNSDKKGKWWLVGASWKGHGQQHEQRATADTMTPKRSSRHDVLDPDEVDYNQLFQSQSLGLTLPLHRTIFVAITSADDATDVLQRLQKLRLSKKQELENIAPVILRACRAEPQYNPYYGVVSRLLLRERRFKMSFSIALWKFFDLIGERQDADDDSNDGERPPDHNVQAGEVANVAQMYAYLIAKRYLGLEILRTLSFGFTKENASLFLEVLFIALLAQSKLKDQGLVEVFGSIEARQAKAAGYFLRKTVRGSDLLAGKDEAKRLKQACKMAIAALAALERGAISDEEESRI